MGQPRHFGRLWGQVNTMVVAQVKSGYQLGVASEFYYCGYSLDHVITCSGRIPGSATVQRPHSHYSFNRCAYCIISWASTRTRYSLKIEGGPLVAVGRGAHNFSIIAYGYRSLAWLPLLV